MYAVNPFAQLYQSANNPEVKEFKLSPYVVLNKHFIIKLKVISYYMSFSWLNIFTINIWWSSNLQQHCYFLQSFFYAIFLYNAYEDILIFPCFIFFPSLLYLLPILLYKFFRVQVMHFQTFSFLAFSQLFSVLWLFTMYKHQILQKE